MRWLRVFPLIASLLVPAVAPAQSPAPGADVLGQVRIPMAVRANGEILPAGTYDVRLAAVAAGAGSAAGAQRPVEFVSNGMVVGRDVAEVLRDEDLPPIGASAQPVAPGVRVDLLKGGEFLRISVKRVGVRYLVHLPVSR